MTIPGVFPCELDSIDLPNINGVNENIQIVTNDYTSRTSIATNEKASKYFDIASNKLILKNKISLEDRKKLGGPRHQITLVTRTGCEVLAKIMILPTDDDEVELVQVSTEDKVVDGVSWPVSSGFDDTGVSFHFRVNEYTPVMCALKFNTDSIYGVGMTGQLSDSSGDVGSSFTLEQKTIQCASANCENVVPGSNTAVQQDFTDFDNDYNSIWAPNDPACQFEVTLKPTSGQTIPAIFYEISQSATFSMRLSDGSFGAPHKLYSGIQANLAAWPGTHEKKRSGENTITAAVADVDNMPPVFTCISSKCSSDQSHRKL